jgi:hypothetical protein
LLADKELEWSINGKAIGVGRLCLAPRLEPGLRKVLLKGIDASKRVGDVSVDVKNGLPVRPATRP